VDVPRLRVRGSIGSVAEVIAVECVERVPVIRHLHRSVCPLEGLEHRRVDVFSRSDGDVAARYAATRAVAPAGGSKRRIGAVAVTGAHVLIYTSAPEAVRAVFRDVLGLDHVDAGDGWLIFALPPAELGIHPSDTAGHELTLMCDDVAATMTELQARGLEFRGEPEDKGFGIGVTMLLPGGAELLLYEPRHPTRRLKN